MSSRAEIAYASEGAPPEQKAISTEKTLSLSDHHAGILHRAAQDRVAELDNVKPLDVCFHDGEMREDGANDFVGRTAAYVWSGHALSSFF